MAIKRIDKDIEIVIANNTHGSLYYATKNGDTVIDLEAHGDEEYITYAELRTLASSKKKLLANGSFLIVKVIDDDVTVRDVYKSLRLEKVYDQYLKLGATEEIFDAYVVETFLNQAQAEEIKTILDKEYESLKMPLLESAIYLYRTGELTDRDKMRVVAEALGHKSSSAVNQFWSDMEIEE